MSNSFVFELMSENLAVRYRIFFSDVDGTVDFLQISTCSAKPRTWESIPVQVAYDLVGYQEAAEAARDFFEDLGDADERDLIAEDNLRISRGLQ